METGCEVNAKELMESVVAFVRSFGLHKPDQTPCGQPVNVAEAHALMDLATFGPVRQGELASRLQLEKSTVSRLVRQMEVHGWIQRSRDRADRRVLLIRLTRQGRKAAVELIGARQRKFAGIISAIPEDKREMVVEAISILERACSRDRSGSGPSYTRTFSKLESNGSLVFDKSGKAAPSRQSYA
jgi:DNA-binding MarR family transcriptional regulator